MLARLRQRIRDRRQGSADAGETLLELIITITIMGAVVVAFGSAIALSVRMSAIHRAQADAQAWLHTYAETLQSGYHACSGAVPPDYVSIGSLTAPSATFDTPTAAVKFWNPTTKAFDSTTCPATDPGLQQVTLVLTSTGGTVDESLVVTLRKLT